MQVAAVRLEIEDGIADELPGPVVGDVAAAAGLEELDAEQASFIGVEQDVRGIGGRAERDDVRVLEQQELVNDIAVAPPPNQVLLQRERALVIEATEPPRLERPRRADQASSGNVSSASFSCARKRAASAPSTMRWS